MNALQMSIDRSNELKSRSEKADNRKKHHDRGLIANKTILAIDPGTTKSAYCLYDGHTPLDFEIYDNETMLSILNDIFKIACDWVVIEKVASMGMAVGQDVFETVFWTGRFVQELESQGFNTWDRMPRKDVKMHLCNSTRAKDANIITALIDRFDPDRRGGKYGKGTKKNPGYFYNFSKDIWQAFALAVTYWDLHK